MSFDYSGGIIAAPTEIQGNILRAFTRTTTTLSFIRFGNDVATNRAWLASNVLAAGAPFRVTSADDQRREELRDKRRVNFFLTPTGYQKLGHDPARLDLDEAFRRGSRDPRTLSTLNDPAVNQWQAEYRKAWDAVVLVACPPQEQVDVLAELDRALQGFEHYEEEGNVLDSAGAPVTTPTATERYEPFGYKDGLSQFYFEESHAAEDGIVEPLAFDPRRTLPLVLRPDPIEPMTYGSLFVYRKLKQDVKEFHQKVDRLADELLNKKGRFLFDLYQFKDGRMSGGTDAFIEFDSQRSAPTKAEVVQLVLASIMGRTPSGVVPEHGKTASASVYRDNEDIDFSLDRGGTRCPFHSHIRKHQPRGGSGDREDERKRIIVRRSVPYGRSDTARAAGQSQQGQTDCGLLFLCAQSDIASQFEFLQKRWSNDAERDFAQEPTPGADHVSAQPPERRDELDTVLGRDRFKRYASTIDADFHVYDLVTLQGAEYLFAPSIPALNTLGGVST
jgi:deferrochelatase/peroxidase EfeB